MKKSLFILFAFCAISQVQAQVSITSSGAVTEDFSSLAASATAALPSGWKMSAAGAGNTATYSTAGNLTTVTQQASTGSPTAGGRYNWGSSASERAIGFMTSGSVASPNSIMVQYKNDIPGTKIIDLSVSFDYERYRINTAAAGVTFFTSTDGTTWTAQTGGDSGAFSTGTNAYNFAPTPVNKSLTLTGVNITGGESIYLRWVFNTTGANSQGIALDNVVLQATVLPVELTSFNVANVNNNNELRFTTASESNNSHFEIERSNNGKNFETISRIEGKGTTQEVSNYSFTDRTPNKGINYYRLKQVDLDGRFEYSKVVSVYAGQKELAATVISASADVLRLKIFSQNEDDAVISIVDMNGRIVLSQKASLTAKDNQLDLDVNLQNGMYVVKITTLGGEQTSKMLNIK
jgi:Secretion system C-terminal sorting domain